MRVAVIGVGLIGGAGALARRGAGSGGRAGCRAGWGGSSGASPVPIDAETRARLLATVGHLPHVLANVLVSQAAADLASEGETLPRVGPSFRDTTRVAGASSGVWTDIYLANAEAIASRIDDTMARLQKVAAALRAGDASAVEQWNEEARESRRKLLEAELAGGPV